MSFHSKVIVPKSLDTTLQDQPAKMIVILACYLSILEEERECNDGADEEAVVEESVDDHCRS